MIPDTEVEQAWLQEAERRRKEMLDGVVQGIPAEEVFARVSRIVRKPDGSRTSAAR